MGATSATPSVPRSRANVRTIVRPSSATLVLHRARVYAHCPGIPVQPNCSCRSATTSSQLPRQYYCFLSLRTLRNLSRIWLFALAPCRSVSPPWRPMLSRDSRPPSSGPMTFTAVLWRPMRSRGIRALPWYPVPPLEHAVTRHSMPFTAIWHVCSQPQPPTRITRWTLAALACRRQSQSLEHSTWPVVLNGA